MQALRVDPFAAFVAAWPGTPRLELRAPRGARTARPGLAGPPEIERTQPIVGIRHHGGRSAQVVAFLQPQGVQAVYNLAGGIDAGSPNVDPSLPCD